MLSHWFTQSTLPEQDLVLAACRSRFTREDLGTSAALANPLYSIQLADELGVLGIASSVIKNCPCASPVWAHAWASNAARNTMLVSELRRWILTLRSHGFEPIVFKGPALAKLAFGNISHRDCCDLDLIVPFDQFWKAVDVFRSLGAAPLCPEILFGQADPCAFTFSVPLVNDTYTVDLHAGWVPAWGVLPERKIHESETIEIELGGIRVRTLGARLLLMQTVSHFFQHFFSLKTLTDVIAALRYVRRVGLEPACEELARCMALRERLDRARLAADEFLQFGHAPSIPWRQGAPAALTTPTPMKSMYGVALHRWFGAQSNDRNIVSHAWRTIWPEKRRLSVTHEWVGPEHLLLRRFLRPVRLAAKAMRESLPRPATVKPAWRRRAYQNLSVYRSLQSR